jgi:dTDP-glucose 4,6-dehydratase
MRRLLITGGAGFIGANFVQYWARKYPRHRLVVLDALTYAGNLASLAPVSDTAQLRFVHGNICDIDLVDTLLAEEKIDTVVNFAAESHVDRSIVGPDPFIDTNIVGTHTLLKAAHRAWSGGKRYSKDYRFHHVSTDEVYGSLGPTDPAFTEPRPFRILHVRLMRPARLLRITWSAPTATPMGCHLPLPIARTTMGPTNFPKSCSR